MVLAFGVLYGIQMECDQLASFLNGILCDCSKIYDTNLSAYATSYSALCDLPRYPCLPV